ncbi:hypothetical protein AN640_02535 [Candidatus Epulonipiscium fishelsonii]|uniref:Uncharacterized protein n=1 Tax=Candidatus Epulonipiscium fishelsonii TaxID=77094 RepID=A0ACC8X8S0_9FIRM|nr:hypothetical protein AN640_02535 [Epulopiscium sp. SCG-D08WGA-EpuloA1]OON92272.1 MAG: hypothetical protein ATN32_09840 [Epulopiscium sp. AS2M-Bin002]
METIIKKEGTPQLIEICIHKTKSKSMYKVLLIWPTLSLITGIMLDTPYNLYNGLCSILNADGILLTDYFLIGGIGASLINSAILTYLNIYLLYKLDLKPNGIIISAIFLVSGFGLIGKNISNICPFYIGGYIYSRYHNIEYKKVVIINMLSTALSPLGSILINGILEESLISLCIIILINAFIGFIMPPICASTMIAHSGYNLYNMGFATGLIGVIVYAFMDSFGLQTLLNTDLYEGKTTIIIILLLFLCLIFIVLGYILNSRSFKGFKDIFKHSGRIVTDLVQLVGFGLTLINMGLLGLMSIGYIFLFNGTFNGPTVTAVLVVMGFGAFGKNLKNTIPIILGASFMAFMIKQEITTTTLIISALFGTSLAPIAGEFGFFRGILAGMMHMVLTLNVINFHGGLVLYSNGFSAGIVATIFIPMLDAFRKGEA